MADPADSLARAIIPPTVVTGLVEIGRREGYPVSSWLDGTGLSPDDLSTSDTVRLSYQQAATILRRAIRAMPDQPIGMQVGRREALLSFGIVGLAMRACATGAEALQIALELHRASGSLVDANAEIADGQVTLSIYERAPDPELATFLVEEALCSAVVFMRSVFGTDQSPTSVDLSYPAPVYAHEYRRFFRCPVRFEADANHLRFPVALLERRLPTHDGTVRAVAIDACRRLLDGSATRPAVAVSVEALLSRNIRCSLTMAEVADQLHVTERTLRRQLDAAGESFSAVRDRVREQRATFLLCESKMTIDAVAREVGFSDGREFRRAYLRWTRRTPSVVRRNARTDPIPTGIRLRSEQRPIAHP